MRTTGNDGVTIPDHEVVTRRAQFRCKKVNAEAKEKKKAAKKIEVEQKKAAKELKKAAKEDAKKKKGMNAAEKLDGRTKRGRKAKAGSQGSRVDEDHKEHEVAAAEGSQPLSKVAPPGRCKGLKRLRKMEAGVEAREAQVKEKKKRGMRKGKKAQLKMDPEEEKSKTKTTGEEVDEEKNETKEIEKTEKVEKESSKTAKGKKNEKKKGKNQEKAKKDNGKKSAKKTKQVSKAEEEDQAANGLSKPSQKRTAAKSRPEPKRKSSRVSRVDEAAPVDEHCKRQIKDILTECKRSHCTHPSWERHEKKAVELVPYWTRKACGIKVDRNLLSGDKAKGKGRAQIEYFSGATPCPYTNIHLCQLWVSRSQMVLGQAMLAQSPLFIWHSLRVSALIPPPVQMEYHRPLQAPR